MNNNEQTSLLNRIDGKLSSIEQIVDKDYLGEIDENKIFDETIKDVGAKEEDFGMLADKAVDDPCKPGNPREVSREDFIELYRQALSLIHI